MLNLEISYQGKKTRYYGDRKYVQTVLGGAPRGQQVLIGKTSGKPAKAS